MHSQGWKDKLNCTVNVGIGSGSQQTKLQSMGSIMGIIQKLIENGGMNTLVTSTNIYNAVSEYVTQAGYKNPDVFVSNPAMMPPPPPPQPTVDEKIATQKRQVELQKLQTDSQVSMLELKLKKDMATVELAIKQQELEINKQELEIKKAELALEVVQERPVKIGND